jgi:hypothetical protein
MTPAQADELIKAIKKIHIKLVCIGFGVYFFGVAIILKLYFDK